MPVKEYPVVKVSLSEAAQNKVLGVQRAAIDETLMRTIDTAMTKHAVTICAVTEAGEKMWNVLRTKYNLSSEKSYGISSIDGHHFICEIP